jgi:hypothetical protein
VACNRVHLLEFGHVDIAEPTNLTLWLSNFPDPYTTGVRALNLVLLLSLGRELCFDT